MITFARVADLAEQIRGVSYGKTDATPSPRSGHLPILRAGNITEEGLAFDDLVYVPAERISAKQKIRCGDVVIAASSGSLDIVGKAASALSDFEGAFGAFCKVLRPSSKVDPGYFAHYFRTADYRRRVSALAAGVNINNLRNEHLDELHMPLPSLDEQRRIAAILDKADALRAKRRAALAQFDTLTQAIFLEMFGDPVENPLGWKDRKLDHAVSLLQYGPRFYNQPYADDGVRIARITDLDQAGELHFQSMPRMRISDRDIAQFTLLPGDLIFARSGATVGKVSLFRAGDPPTIPGAYFIRIRLKPEVTPEYAKAVLTTNSVQAIIAAQSRQAAQQNFSGPGLRRLPMPLPAMTLQQEFAARVRAIQRLKRNECIGEAKLGELFRALQHRAFRGEL